jgi:eukaryotic-like serine/threonine-protein kinase
MAQGALLDLVCGPASPLPETYQRYRLVAHLGSGGQADVYRAVRLCGGVTSAPLTVKVFRVDPQRPLVDELRSWDKGDAALMDLNNRGVPAICRRADGFYGPPPHRPGERAAAGDAVPYQVYDYLHGINLREYISQRAGLASGARRLNALTTLKTLSGVLRNLHFPQDGGSTPVLHMDIKPSNLMVLTNGEVRLIDFTGAR